MAFWRWIHFASVEGRGVRDVTLGVWVDILCGVVGVVALCAGKSGLRLMGELLILARGVLNAVQYLVR